MSNAVTTLHNLRDSGLDEKQAEAVLQAIETRHASDLNGLKELLNQRIDDQNSLMNQRFDDLNSKMNILFGIMLVLGAAIAGSFWA